MQRNFHFPTLSIYDPIWFMDNSYSEPFTLLPSTRHDGWTGEVMAKFLEALAETGIVMDACDAAGRSRETAYALPPP